MEFAKQKITRTGTRDGHYMSVFGEFFHGNETKEEILRGGEEEATKEEC